MKKLHEISSHLFGAALLATMLLAVSCADEIRLSGGDFGKYETATTPYGYIRNAVSPSDRLVDLYQTSVERKVEVAITKALPYIVEMKVEIDEEVLAKYNKDNRKKFEMFPAELVTIGQGGVSIIPPGLTKADPIKVSIAPDASLTEGKTYAVPLRISTKAKGIEIEDDSYLFFVTAKGERLDPAKSTGYKVLSCMETGDADPRIHCELFLENSGKPLVDIVVLFSGNINYNASEGRVYLHTNNSITPILSNRDRYIKPLQDMGIKVVLGLMGNHDRSGISHLEEHVAREFIRNEVAPLIETYGLDGVFWDDEYTATTGPIPPGMTTENNINASRLVFESRRAMPDKLNIVFGYGPLIGLRAVDGVRAGEYVDYITSNYSKDIELGYWGGATSRQGMPYPYEMNEEIDGKPSVVVSDNRGGIMVFAMGEQRDNWESYQIPALQDIASTMFGDNLYYTGVSYPLEW